MSYLWETNQLVKTFSAGSSWGQKQQVYALQGVSLYQNQGETLGIVGESGCGKSTFGMTLMGLHQPTSGTITMNGQVINPVRDKQIIQQTMQMVFQNPYASLNPRMMVRTMLEEPLLVHTNLSQAERRDRVNEVLSQVGIGATQGERYAHEFSGGQRQRIGIARSLIMNPSCIICDEPISALDVSIQVQIMTLLERLQQNQHMSYVFISHDLNMVRYISHRMAVMYLGAVMEEGSAETIYARPLHPYTKALLAVNGPVVPHMPFGQILEGEPPNPISPPKGCLFSGRCPEVEPRCLTERPTLNTVDGRQVACFHCE